jgi:DNA ligase-1
LNDGVHAWNNSFLLLHRQELCRDVSHLRAELQRIEALGGEGLMLREPGSKYVTGRSSTLLKVKTFHDAEAIVVGHEAGKGKHSGRLGALVVQLPNGKQFSVGTGFSDRQRESPPSIGSLIQFRYQELSDGGIPRFPSYVGLRTDIDSSATNTGAVSKASVNPSDSKPISIQAKPSRSGKKKTAVSKPAAASNAESPAGSNAARRFVLVEDSSSKFWEVSISGDEVTTRWGRIGSDGQTKTKSFATPSKAQAEYDKLIAEKTGKGYEEVIEA